MARASAPATGPLGNVGNPTFRKKQVDWLELLLSNQSMLVYDGTSVKRMSRVTTKPMKENEMKTSNKSQTAKFLSVIDVRTKNDILTNIASHYGITVSEALAEVTDRNAEHLLDYVTGPMRAATSVLMQRHGMAYA
jgi:hypothetical protein